MQLHLITKTITEASSRTINCHGSHCKLNENQNKNSVYRDVCLATASPTLNWHHTCQRSPQSKVTVSKQLFLCCWKACAFLCSPAHISITRFTAEQIVIVGNLAPVVCRLTVFCEDCTNSITLSLRIQICCLINRWFVVSSLRNKTQSRMTLVPYQCTRIALIGIVA